MQRTVFYLGEISDQQQGAWRKTLAVFDEQQQKYADLSLFPYDREIPGDAVDSLQVKLCGLEPRRPSISWRCKYRREVGRSRERPSSFVWIRKNSVRRNGVTDTTCCAPTLLQQIPGSLGRATCNGHRSNRYSDLSRANLGIRPIYHQREHRADAHILIAFLVYCLQITLKHRLLLHAPGLTRTVVLEKSAEIKSIGVWIPTVDRRWLILLPYIQPSLGTKMLI